MPTRENARDAGRPGSGDFYSVLGVPRAASTDDIRKAYRKLARKYHPDVNPGDKAAEERFKEISRAHDTLSDEKQRALYDEFGEDALQGGFDPERARQFRQWQRAQSGAGSPFGGGRARRGRGSGGDAGFGGFEDLFGGMFRGGPVPERGADLEVPVEVELLEAVRGTSRSISVRRPETCPSCHGSGASGRSRCGRCGGEGTVEQSVRLNVKIPAGVETGSRVRVPGKGGEGTEGAPAGDLYMAIEVKEHPLLRREGNDLTLEVPVTVSEAALGATITVPTPDGEVSLRIPAGTQSGRRLRLRGKGVPSLQGRTRGDFYVRVMVHVPASAEKVREALASLEEAYEGDVRRELRL